MADSALDKIIRLAGVEMAHGSDVAHNAAVRAVMKDRTGTANHTMRDGTIVHSVKNSDGAVVLSPAAQDAMGLAAPSGSSHSDGLVVHGVLNDSTLSKKDSAVQRVREMTAAQEEAAEAAPAKPGAGKPAAAAKAAAPAAAAPAAASGGAA